MSSWVGSIPTRSRQKTAMQYAYQEPGPKGTIQVARPELTWPIVPRGEAQVANVQLFVDGERVPARYAAGAVRYTPTRPLAPGPHKAQCQVSLLPRQKNPTVEWEFTVAAGAIETLPPPSAWSQSALATANQLRARLSLPPLQLDPRLSAAAQGHVAYLERNKLTGHLESPSKPGFLGENPLARAQAFGFSATIAEDVSLADGSAAKIVQALYDAPYHRLPFLRPGNVLFGAGSQGRSAALLFGGDGEKGLVVSPYDGETGVPTTWRNDEQPSPLRFYANTPKVVGYPIVLAHYAAPPSRLGGVKASLRIEGGAEVPCFVNTPERDDELTYALVILPTTPLRPSTTYLVEVTAHDSQGGELARRWRFTTGAASESDFTPLDLRPGDLKLTGTIKAVDGKKERLTFAVQEAQAYGTASKRQDKPVPVTLQLTPQTRFLALDPTKVGRVAFKAGMPLTVIVPNGPLERPLPTRTVLVGR